MHLHIRTCSVRFFSLESLTFFSCLVGFTFFLGCTSDIPKKPMMSNLDSLDNGYGLGATNTGTGTFDPNNTGNMGAMMTDPNMNMGAMMTDPNMNMGGMMTDPNMNMGGMMTDPNMNMGGMMTDPNMNMGGMMTDPDMNMGGMVEECEMDELIGLCELCDGTVPSTDPSCPALSLCPTDGYQVIENDEGVSECYQNTYTPPAEGGCLALGECLPEEDQVCEVSDQVLLATNGECQSFTGCTDTEPPEIENAENGTICGSGWGQCDEGQCIEPPAPCDQAMRYNTRNIFCESPAENQCSYYVNGRGSGRNENRITCEIFCEEYVGGSCVDGFNNPENDEASCETRDRTGCDENYRDQICICSLN